MNVIIVWFFKKQLYKILIIYDYDVTKTNMIR